MFIERMTWNPKPGKELEVRAVLKEFRDQFPGPHGHRILRCAFGTWSAVAEEVDWESWDEHVRVWEGWMAKPEFVALAERFWELVEPAATREIWDPVE